MAHCYFSEEDKRSNISGEYVPTFPDEMEKINKRLNYLSERKCCNIKSCNDLEFQLRELLIKTNSLIEKQRERNNIPSNPEDYDMTGNYWSYKGTIGDDVKAKLIEIETIHNDLRKRSSRRTESSNRGGRRKKNRKSIRKK